MISQTSIETFNKRHEDVFCIVRHRLISDMVTLPDDITQWLSYEPDKTEYYDLEEFITILDKFGIKVEMQMAGFIRKYMESPKRDELYVVKKNESSNKTN